jgi:hypothetical protein
MPHASRAGERLLPATFTGRLQNGEAMPTLHDEIKEFIVRGLARFETPTHVADAVREKFGIEVSRQQVYRYDPANPEPPSQRWREVHAATRRAFLRDVAEVGVAQKAVRLAMLDRMVHHAMANDRFTRAAGFLEQAAKECGGIYEKGRAAVPSPGSTTP